MKLKELQKIIEEKYDYYQIKADALSDAIECLNLKRKNLLAEKLRIDTLSEFISANDLYHAVAYLVSIMEGEEYVSIRMLHNDMLFNYVIRLSYLENNNTELYNKYMEQERIGMEIFEDDDRVGNPYEKDFLVFSTELYNQDDTDYKKLNINERYEFDSIEISEVKFMLKNQKFSYVWEYIYDVINYQIEKNDYATFTEMISLADTFANSLGKGRILE